MKMSVLLACLALVSIATAFNPHFGGGGYQPEDRGTTELRTQRYRQGQFERCKLGLPHIDMWKCFQAMDACRVTENNVVTKNITCDNGSACAGSVTIFGNLKFQWCGPVACTEKQRWNIKCQPETERDAEERRRMEQRNTGRGRWSRRSMRSPDDAFQPPPSYSQAEIKMCGLNTVQKQRWYHSACLVKQGTNEVKKANCRHNGVCSASTQTTYMLNGVQYTVRFCTGCNLNWGPWGQRPPWGSQNSGRGSGQQNPGRGSGQQNSGRGGSRQNTGRGTGRGQQNTGRGRRQQNSRRGLA